MKEFLHEYHERNGEKVCNGWWEIDGNKLVNFVGGFHYYNPQPDDVIVEANSFEELDWAGCPWFCNNKEKTGWLDLQGIFYPCEPMEHNRYARFIFKVDERDLEQLGWIKVLRSPIDARLLWSGLRRPNEFQTKWLIDNELLENEI